MPRHWERIAQVTGHSFDINSESFSLKNIMDACLLKYKEDIEVDTHTIFKYWLCDLGFSAFWFSSFLCSFVMQTNMTFLITFI